MSHEAALPGAVSVIAKQTANSFEPFVAKAGGTIEMLETGTVSADAMFTAAHQANKFMTWLLRLVGFILMFVGFSLLFRPLSVLADVVPMIGSIVGVGTGFVSFLLSLPLSLLVISVAWIFYRPLVGIRWWFLPLAASLSSLVSWSRNGRKNRSSRNRFRECLLCEADFSALASRHAYSSDFE